MSEPADEDYSMKFDESAGETLTATARSERNERDRSRDRTDRTDRTDRDTSTSVTVDSALVNSLYSGLKRSGFLGQVKTQLRSRIVHDLRERAASRRALVKENKTAPQSDSLTVRVANSVVLQHLQACKYEYTLSIFVPECGLDGETKAVSTNELLDLLRIDRESKVAKRLTSSGDRQFLLALVRLMLESLDTAPRNPEITDGNSSPIAPRPVGGAGDVGKSNARPRKTLAEKFDEIDRSYNSKIAPPVHDTDFVDESVRRKLEAEFEERFRKAFEFETARFRELELERVKKEQFERYRADVDRVRRSARDELENRIRNETESCRAQVDKIRAEADARERELFVARQKLLADTATLTDRHATLDRDRELFEKLRKMEEAKWAAEADAMAERERAIAKREAEFESRVAHLVDARKSELESTYREKLAEAEALTSRARAEAQRIDVERRGLDELRSRLLAKQGTLTEMDLQSYDQVRDALAARESECLSLHEAVSEAEQREAALRDRIEKLSHEARVNGDAANSARDAQSQLAIVTRERDALRDAREKDVVSWSREREALVRRVTEEARERERLRSSLEDERDRHVVLQRTVNELSAELQITREFASRTPRTARISGRLTRPSSDLRLSLPRTEDTEPDGVGVGDAGVGIDNGGPVVDELIFDSRVRLQALTSEADSLERAYRDLAHRLGDAGPPHTLTPAAIKLGLAPGPRRMPLTSASAAAQLQQPTSAKSGGSSSRQAESVTSGGAHSAGSGPPLSTSTAHLPVAVSFDLPYSATMTTTTGTGTTSSGVPQPQPQPQPRSNATHNQVLVPPAGSGLPSFSLPAAAAQQPDRPFGASNAAVTSAATRAAPTVSSYKPASMVTPAAPIWSDSTLTSLTNPGASGLFGATLGFEQASLGQDSYPPLSTSTSTAAASTQPQNAVEKKQSVESTPVHVPVPVSPVRVPVEVPRTPNRSEVEKGSGRTETQSDDQLPTVVDLDAFWNDQASNAATVPRSVANSSPPATAVETPKKQVRIAEANPGSSSDANSVTPAKQPEVTLRDEPEIDPAMRKYMELMAQQRTPTATLTGTYSTAPNVDLDFDVDTDSERRPSANVPALDLDFDNSTSMSARRTSDRAGNDDSVSDDKFW